MRYKIDKNIYKVNGVTEEAIERSSNNIITRPPGPRVNHVLDAVQPHLHIVSTVHNDLLFLVKWLVGIAHEPTAGFDPKARSTY